MASAKWAASAAQASHRGELGLELVESFVVKQATGGANSGLSQLVPSSTLLSGIGSIEAWQKVKPPSMAATGTSELRMVEIGQQSSLLMWPVQLSLPPPSLSSSSSIWISTLKNNQQNVVNIWPLTYIYLKSTIDGVDTEDSKYKVVGINKQVWLLVIRYKHLDLTRSIHLSSLNPISDGYKVNEVPIYEKQPPLSWSFAPLPVVILLHSYACQIYKRVQMVSERPKMNRYTHSKTTKFYHEQSMQTWEGHENSKTEESDFGPCLIGIDPHSSPVTLPSHY